LNETAVPGCVPVIDNVAGIVDHASSRIVERQKSDGIRTVRCGMRSTENKKNMPAPTKTAMHTEEFMKFIVEREAVRAAREYGKPWPWTADPILQQYKFCNVQREDDRVTRWVATNWRKDYATDPNTTRFSPRRLPGPLAAKVHQSGADLSCTYFKSATTCSAWKAPMPSAAINRA
jgi:hypothetical protein